MVKKSYVMPVSNETRARLRTGLLAGSGPTFGTDPVEPVTGGGGNSGVGAPGEERGGEVRRRSVSSID